MRYLLLSLFFAHIAVQTFSQSGNNEKSTTPVILKNFILNEKHLITKGLLNKSRNLSKQELASFSLSKIDEVYSPGYVYKLIDTLHKSKGYYIVLLGRGSENENSVWMASYGTGRKLIDFRQVYYDNTEGFLLVETEIKNNMISITTTNEYEESKKMKTERFRLASSFKLQQIQ